jgi:hypothetical protein
MATQYELVLRFALPPRDVARFDRVTEFESKLAAETDDEVGDHDCTSGRIEIKIFTDDPKRSFETIRGMIPERCPYDAGYRGRWSEEVLTSLA